MVDQDVWGVSAKVHADQRAGQLAQLQQVTGLAGVAGTLHKLQLESQFRSEIGNARTPEERSAVASKYASPGDIFKRDTESADAKLKADTLRELQAERLKQQADNLEKTHSVQIMGIQARKGSQDEINAEHARHNKAKEGLEQFGRLLGIPKQYYETGDSRLAPGGSLSTPPAATPPAAAPPPVAAPEPPAQAMPTNMQIPPAVQAQRDAQATAIKGNELLPNGGGMLPTASVVQGSAPPPAAIAAQLGPQVRSPSAPSAPPPAPIPTAPVAGNAPTPVPAAPPAIPPNVQQMLDGAKTGKERADIMKAYNKSQMAQSFNIAGGRESMMINRVIVSANEAAKDISNVVRLPLTATRGFFGGRGQGEGIFNAGKETLANAMTTQEVQSYNVRASGLIRSLATIETSGLAPPGSFSKSLETVLAKEGDKNITKLEKLAQTRQIVDAGIESALTNPRIAEEQKKHLRDVQASIAKSVPFTIADIDKLRESQAINPKITLKDVIKLTGGGNDDPAPPGVDAKLWKHATPEERKLWQTTQ